MDEADKELLRNGLKAANYSDEQIEAIISKQEYLRRNVKYGDNVIHLTYSEGVTTENELKEFNSNFEKAGFQLSFYDDSREPKASVADEFVQLAIKNEVWKMIVGAVVGGVAYDLFKTLFLKLWNDVKEAKFFKATTTTLTPLKMGFRIEFRISNGRLIYLTIPNDVTEQNVIDCLSELQTRAEFIDSQQTDYYVLLYFELTKKGNWREIKDRY